MHDADLVSKQCRNAVSRELLQRDEPIGVRKRAQRRLGITIDVVVDIGSAQAHDQRTVGVKLAKDADALRTAPRVKRHHQVCGASVVGGRVVAVGGESSTGVFPTVESFDINKRQWSGLPPMRTPRHGITVATVGNSVFAIDGAQVPSHGVATNIAEVLPFTAAAASGGRAGRSGRTPGSACSAGTDP